jgi:hypothetical protein
MVRAVLGNMPSEFEGVVHAVVPASVARTSANRKRGRFILRPFSPNTWRRWKLSSRPRLANIGLKAASQRGYF